MKKKNQDISARCLRAQAPPDLTQWLERSRKEYDPELLWELFQRIGAAASRAATRRLIRIVRESPEGPRREGALYALWGLADARARDLFIRVLDDPGQTLRARGFAAEALGLLKPRRRSNEALIRALNDPLPEIQYSAMCGLSGLRPTAALPALERLKHSATVFNNETLGARAERLAREIEEA